MKRLQDEVRRKLCSGQAIPTLTIAVKELLENAIDSGATKVEITLVDKGLTSIEVHDNGSGIIESDLSNICSKGYTSKISNFDDIYHNLTSYGFRGEALSSLCCMAGNFEVLSCVDEDNLGIHAIYRTNGTLEQKSSKRRAKGTTITVSGLFAPFPVRRRELEKSISHHFRKTIELLEEYAVINKNIKISFVDFSKGKRSLLFSTRGNDSIEKNLIDIIGHKVFNTLKKVDLELRFKSTFVQMKGWISKPQFSGAEETCASSAKQFIFINKRPVVYKKISSLLNRVWTENNFKGKCFFALMMEVENR